MIQINAGSNFGIENKKTKIFGRTGWPVADRSDGLRLWDTGSGSMSARIWEKVAGPDAAGAVVFLLVQEPTRSRRITSNAATAIRKYLVLMSTYPLVYYQY